MDRIERFQLFVLPEGVKKISLEIDKLQENFLTVVIEREDHTIGNLLCCSLQEKKEVEFAAYIIPHPLIPKLKLSLKTEQEKPHQTLKNVFNETIRKLDHLENVFLKKIQMGIF